MVFCKKTLSLHQKSKKKGKGACGVATLSLMFREVTGEAGTCLGLSRVVTEEDKSHRGRRSHQESITKVALPS